MINPDIVIIGSGPAGVTAATTLIEKGFKVLMIDYGNKIEDIGDNTMSYLEARRTDNKQHKWILGADYKVLKENKTGTPKLRIPSKLNVFTGFNCKNKIKVQNFDALGSLALGGLSNVWGAGVACLNEYEAKNFPFDYFELQKSYEILFKRIGINAPVSDDLSDFFGISKWIQEPIPLDQLQNFIYKKYKEKKINLRNEFKLGRARLATLSSNYLDREGCNGCGRCLYGCLRKSIYNSKFSLEKIINNKNFQYLNNHLVESIDSISDINNINCRVNEEIKIIRTRKVVLACGTLSTTRIALNNIKLNGKIRLLTAPVATYLLFVPKKVSEIKTSVFAGGQLSNTQKIDHNESIYGTLFNSYQIPISEYLNHINLNKRYSIEIISSLISSCAIGNLFLPAIYSDNYVSVDQDGNLNIIGNYDSNIDRIIKKMKKELEFNFKQIGAYIVPFSFKLGKPGSDYHYAGTLPMKSRPKLGETNLNGELYGSKGIYIVDGACLASLESKPHTLTIMANAERIARNITKDKKDDI